LLLHIRYNTGKRSTSGSEEKSKRSALK